MRNALFVLAATTIGCTAGVKYERDIGLMPEAIWKGDAPKLVQADAERVRAWSEYQRALGERDDRRSLNSARQAEIAAVHSAQAGYLEALNQRQKIEQAVAEAYAHERKTRAEALALISSAVATSLASLTANPENMDSDNVAVLAENLNRTVEALTQSEPAPPPTFDNIPTPAVETLTAGYVSRGGVQCTVVNRSSERLYFVVNCSPPRVKIWLEPGQTKNVRIPAGYWDSASWSSPRMQRKRSFGRLQIPYRSNRILLGPRLLN